MQGILNQISHCTLLTRKLCESVSPWFAPQKIAAINPLTTAGCFSFTGCVIARVAVGIHAHRTWTKNQSLPCPNPEKRSVTLAASWIILWTAIAYRHGKHPFAWATYAASLPLVMGTCTDLAFLRSARADSNNGPISFPAPPYSARSIPTQPQPQPQRDSGNTRQQPAVSSSRPTRRRNPSAPDSATHQPSVDLAARRQRRKALKKERIIPSKWTSNSTYS